MRASFGCCDLIKFRSQKPLTFRSSSALPSACLPCATVTTTRISLRLSQAHEEDSGDCSSPHWFKPSACVGPRPLLALHMLTATHSGSDLFALRRHLTMAVALEASG